MIMSASVRYQKEPVEEENLAPESFRLLSVIVNCNLRTPEWCIATISIGIHHHYLFIAPDDYQVFIIIHYHWVMADV